MQICECVDLIPTEVPRFFFFLGKKSWDLYTSATANDYWRLGMIARASSWVPEEVAASIVTQGCFIGEVNYLMLWGHQELALVYPSFPPPCSQGLGSSIGRASHRRCECVGSIPTQVLRVFLDYLGTCIQVLPLMKNLPSQGVLSSPYLYVQPCFMYKYYAKITQYVVKLCMVHDVWRVAFIIRVNLVSGTSLLPVFLH